MRTKYKESEDEKCLDSKYIQYLICLVTYSSKDSLSSNLCMRFDFYRILSKNHLFIVEYILTF